MSDLDKIKNQIIPINGQESDISEEVSLFNLPKSKSAINKVVYKAGKVLREYMILTKPPADDTLREAMYIINAYRIHHACNIPTFIDLLQKKLSRLKLQDKCKVVTIFNYLL